MFRPFVKNPRDIESMKQTDVYILHEALSECGDFSKLPQDKKDLAENLFDELWNPDSYKYGIYKLQGWKFDFREWMNTYYIKNLYYGIEEVHAFNKTLIRKNAVNPSYILRITEIED